MFLLRHPFWAFFFLSLGEAVLLAEVGSKIGWGWTILLIVATAMIGSAMWRTQGLATWARLNERLRQGKPPAQELLEGVLLMIGGAVLITPGFLTDAIGFALLIPASRKVFAQWLIANGVGRFTGNFKVYRGGASSGGYSSERPQSRTADTDTSTQRHDDGTLEGEYIPRDPRR